MEDFIKSFFIGLVAALIFLSVLCFPLMLLWNWLMPAVFGLPVLTFWQTAGLIIICHILFKPTINVNKD